MKKIILAAAMLLTALPSWAGSPDIYEKTIPGDLEATYNSIHNNLENNGFYVIFEPDIGKNLDGMATKFGKDYNLNKLEAIRSMVFCNAGFANRLSNLDPAALALCPLHITLIQKAGQTTVLFVKPSMVAQGSPAQAIASEIETEVIKSIEAASK
ncbi:MAG TPA: DUF302 domain-containing protein [Sulfuriferula sp.]|nr:DUF302 domain-containing protein [Sulfuriferula sp.]